MNVGVILVAAGQGSRLGAGRPKALVTLGDIPLVGHSVATAAQCVGVTEIVVVAPGDRLDEMAALLPEDPSAFGTTSLDPSSASVLSRDSVVMSVVAGGDSRSASVARGLSALSTGVGIVLVHDVARALTPVDVFTRVVAHVRAGHSAVIPVLAVTDTIKSVDDSGRVLQTLDRSSLRVVQTPQGFLRETLEHAHGMPGEAVTDDAGMVERLGGTVSTVRGDAASFKITTAHDLAVARSVLTDDGQAP